MLDRLAELGATLETAEPADIDQVADALKALAVYAAHTASAKRYRAMGEIGLAEDRERDAEHFYRLLPRVARW